MTPQHPTLHLRHLLPARTNQVQPNLHNHILHGIISGHTRNIQRLALRRRQRLALALSSSIFARLSGRRLKDAFGRVTRGRETEVLRFMRNDVLGRDPFAGVRVVEV